MFRCATFLLISFTANAAEPAKLPPIAAKRVQSSEATLGPALAAIAKQSGIEIDFASVDGSAKVEPVPETDFWLALENLAKPSKTRFAPSAGKVKFAKGPLPPSSVEGPFRVSVKQVTARRDFDSDVTNYDVLLEVSWEPRFPVYLMDDTPKIVSASAGDQKLEALAGSGRVPTIGFRQLATVRLSGVPRSATNIDILKGTFNVVAAEKLLAVEFKDLTAAKPQMQTLDGVQVTLAPVKRISTRVQFDFNLEYPASHPQFESFELWASANKLKLYPPSNRAALEPGDYSTNEAGRRIAASYSFEPAANFADLKGWRAVYETGGPMTKMTVKFELKSIPLP